ncbi:hypothetical protein [Nocardioides sp.]|uniref:hypothetical protein n=1 Tax=Nocardioides sp. TaxID=35761 RepID=UPI002725C167|nr:hypothetical protein [Nocardioides sp.]MDO9455119.1 hypothetical protein [Nocardioides sp.]
MRPSRSLAALAAVTLFSLPALAACGGDSDDDGGTGTDDTSQDTTDAADAPEDADPADPGEGDTEDAGQGGAAGTSAGFADCSAITADEMAPALGEGTGTAEVPPGGGGCNYALDDPRLPSVFLEEFPTSDFADGFDGAKANISNTAVGPIEDPVETDVSDVGDGAKVTVGPSPLGSGDGLQSIGLVLVGDTIVRASVLQASDLDEAALLQVTTDVLTLVASKA